LIVEPPFERGLSATFEKCTPSMDADDVTVVVIQKRRSWGSFRKGFVWESGGFFDMAIL
jgi:hypothetical protein